MKGPKTQRGLYQLWRNSKSSPFIGVNIFTKPNNRVVISPDFHSNNTEQEWYIDADNEEDNDQFAEDSEFGFIPAEFVE